MTAPDQRTDVDVIVVGGGIGGLATALALSLAGRTVRVLEREDEFTEVGAGLQLAPNATRLFRQWGILDEVLAVCVAPERLVFKDALDGRPLTHLDLAEVAERYGAPYVVMHRHDLLTILFDACRRAGVELVAGTAVEHTETTDTGAAVHHADTTSHAAIVVAADGLTSRLRARFSDDELVPSGYVAYRGALPITDVAVDDAMVSNVVVHLGPGRHLVQYALRRGEIFNTVAVFRSPAFLRGEADWGGPNELDGAFVDSCPAVVDGLASLWRDRQWRMHDREPIANWVDGRVVLAGDAAHPMLQYLAQGACQAIEDAACLADQVASHRCGPSPGSIDWSGALASYNAIRTVRTARVQRTARTWGDIWHVDGVARQLRNELFADRRPDDFKHVDWLYGS